MRPRSGPTFLHPQDRTTIDPKGAVHDPTYKKLYSFPRMLEELVRALARHWAEAIDFSTLRKLSTEYVSTGRARRYGDMLWGARLRHGQGHVLVPLEFQATLDYSMPLRVLDYGSSALMEWARQVTLARGDKAALLLPIVIYSGVRPWDVPTRLAELLPATNPALLVNQPLYEHFLLEERRGGTSGLPAENLVTALVGVVRARTQDDLVMRLIRLHDQLGDDREGALDRALTTWTKRLLSSLHTPWVELATATTLKEVLEVIKPTGEWAVRWYEDGLAEGREQGREQGRKQGRKQGREQGRSEGQALVVRQLAIRKFGAETARRVSEALDQLSDPEEIRAVADAVIDCDTPEDFLARVPPAPPHTHPR